MLQAGPDQYTAACAAGVAPRKDDGRLLVIAPLDALRGAVLSSASTMRRAGSRARLADVALKGQPMSSRACIRSAAAQSPPGRTARAWQAAAASVAGGLAATAAAALLLAACAGAPPAGPVAAAAAQPHALPPAGGPAAPAARPAAGAAPASAGSAAAPAAPAAAAVPPAATDATADAGRRAFSTRHAYFAPAAWSALPGWREDDLGEAWRAFLQSCSALARRPGWEAPCGRAARTGSDRAALRGFFEREFVLYEIRNTDRTPDGVITGYYEPLLAGSRVRQGRYVHPVYGVPADMLVLDVRLWPKALRGQAVRARVDGRQVIPAPGAAPQAAPYLLDIGSLTPDDRDKKLRLRLDGDRVVPYHTRAEIERGGLPQAPVLAWVDNPAALYSMQIQGSGKIRLADGRMLRLAYAEQNGHPFRPPVRRAADGAGRVRLTTRGLGVELPEADDAELPDAAPEAAGASDAQPLTRGRRPAPVPAAASGEVELMIERLAAGTAAPGRTGAAGAPPAPGRPAAATATPPSGAAAAASRRQEAPSPARADAAPPQASPQLLAAISTDPSYVFFREIPDGPGGPIGALGVPLTPGRSVAVDPRTTPLGFPVFLDTDAAGAAGPLKRLMMAQDTGGAIRGAVRADYFWGFGAEAYARAAGMKQRGRMWLLLPRGLQVAARDQPLTRGARGDAAPDCVVADDDSCVEDR